MTEDRGELDLTLVKGQQAKLIEEYQKEIREFKQKEYYWEKTQNQLDRSKKVLGELAIKFGDLGKANIALKKRAQEAEGENTIIKGIGNNSPEMKELQSRVKQLDESLARALEINENHQRYNGKLQTRLTQVEEDNKKLAKQIQDMNEKRKFGDGTY